MGSQLLQMKISLNNIKPQIWRRFTVDSSISLDKFHEIIQFVMGWTNSHLYEFTIDGIAYSPSVEDDFFENESENTKGKTLEKLGVSPKQKIKYLYDFGDYWEHTIVIEKIYDQDSEIIPPFCIEGARNCPPEDCGSTPGYEEIVQAMKNPRTKKAKEFTQWLGYSYDPEEFDLEEINFALKMFQKKKGKKPTLRIEEK